MNAQGEFLPPPAGGQKLNIVVIGGGVSGVLTTLSLTHAGHQVTMLEKGSLGSGSSQRSAACIRQQFATPSTVRGMVYATRFFENWREITGMSENPLRQNGYLFLYDYRESIDAVRQRVEMQRAAGLKEVEFLLRDEVGARFPYINTIGLTCATLCPTDGFLLPQIIYNDGAEAARNLGASIVVGAEVNGVEYDGSRIKAVLTTKGRFAADLVINTTNAWASHVSQLLGGSPLPISSTRRYLYFAPGLNGQDGDIMTAEQFRTCPMVIGPNGAYSRPTPQHELMMGWLQHVEPLDPLTADQDEVEKGFGCSQDGYGMAVMTEVSRWLPEVRSANSELGQIARLTQTTCGFYADVPDHNFIIDFDTRVPNLIHAAGCSGHGLMHSPFTACLVARLVEKGGQANDMQLPLGLGEVDMTVYHIDRDFSGHEAMRI